MASEANQLHFVLFPFMAQGHMIPMIDIARLLAQRGMIITIVTTPLNAARFKTILARAIESGLQIRLAQVEFPCAEAGLPERCENIDVVPSLDMASNFITAANLLLKPVEKLFEELTPQPTCIISDFCLPYTTHIANKFHVPRISFHGFGCFYLLCLHNLFIYKVLESVTSDSEYFVVPGFPDKIELNKAQITNINSAFKDIQDQMGAADQASYGVVTNTFEELEPAYVKDYKKARKDKVWCIGPVSLCNKDELDKAQRGNKALIDEHQCMKWLDSQEHKSVVYASFGSVCNLVPLQLIELGLGLEASQKPFIWVIRGGHRTKEVETWITESGFEERIKGKGLIIRGWAPQVLILSHPAVGGFLTHCGWNSILEGISAGVPLITWPLFGDQFGNEKLVVQILNIGVRVGAEEPMRWGEEEKIGLLVKKDDVKKAVEMLMDEGEEREERRKRAQELGEMAKRAVEEGGSSYLDITLLIQDIMQQAHSQNKPNI